MQTIVERPARPVRAGRRRVLALAGVLALVGVIASAPARAARAPERAGADTVAFARYADALEAFGFSGQLLVAERGRVVFERACGWADVRYHVPMTPGTRLAIGSITKNFVAAAVLQLETRGTLRLQDRLADRLPDVPADKAAITLEQLLCHMGGVSTDIPDGLENANRDEVVQAVLAEPLAAPPGERFLYSNAGFDLLAAVVERAAGEPFERFVQRELLTPAGLRASGIAGSPSLPAGPGATGGNEWDSFGDWRDWPAGWSGTGSGRMVSTAHELWQWSEALRSGRVLTAGAFARMHTPHAAAGDSVHYGLGLWLRARPDGRTLWVLGGEVPGYAAECMIDTTTQRTVVVCTNLELAGRAAHRRAISNTLLRMTADVAFAPPAPAVQPFVSGSARALEGVWVLTTGGRIEIREQDGRLRLGARGQDAVDLFQSAAPEAVARRHETARRAQAVMRAAVNADTAALHVVLPERDYAFLWPFLRDQLRAHRATFGALQGVTSLGAVDMAWPGGTRAYARLRFPDHTSDLMLGWTSGRFADVAFDEGRPYPVMLGVAPVVAGGYAAFDLEAARAVRLELERGPGAASRLRVRGEAGEGVALRRE